MNKPELRRLCKAISRGLTVEYRRAASASIAGQLIAVPGFRSAGTVFVYLSMESEPDTAPILEAALSAGKRVCVPRSYAPPRMDAVRYTSREELRPGRYGIPEPPPAAAVIPAREIDFAVIPCVCASLNGARLGHGAGYYDAFLGPHPRIETVCLCFGALLREDIPMSPSDIFIGQVISERDDLRRLQR